MNTFEIKSIGTVSSSLRTLDAAPRQADEGAPEAWLVFEPAAIDGTPIVDVKPVLSPDIGRR
jgi:tRNA (Thr-GGU) A37 N-methylase